MKRFLLNGENKVSGQETSYYSDGTKLENIGKMTLKTDGTIKAELVAQVPGDSPQVEYTVRKEIHWSRIGKNENLLYDRWISAFAPPTTPCITDPDLLRRE